MRCFIICLFFSLDTGLIYGQCQRTYGTSSYDYAEDIVSTSDGGFAIIGRCYDLAGPDEYDIYFLKTDGNGALLWSTQMGGGNDNDGGRSLEKTPDGGFVICGTTYSYGAGEGDAILIKTGSTGNIQWAKTFGGGDRDYGMKVRSVSSGGFIMTGHTESFGMGAPFLTDIYLIRTDANGSLLWSRTYGNSASGESAMDVREIPGGGFIVTGNTPGDAYLLKTDADGNLLWYNSFSSGDLGNSVYPTSDGGFILTGKTEGGTDIYLLKVNGSGSILWTWSIGGSGTDEGYFVQELLGGDYIVTGSYAGDVLLLRTDPYGSPLWARTFGGTGGDAGYSLQVAGDGFAIAGYSMSFGTSSDFYYIRTDINGLSGCNEVTVIPAISSPATTISVPIGSTGSGAAVGNPVVGVNPPATIAAVLCQALSVGFTHFDVKEVDKEVELNWGTAQEYQNEYFIIERAKDVHTFESIGKVKSKGASSHPLVYSFTDKVPYEGVSYYRLKQVNSDGTFSYSKVAELFLGTELEFGILNLSPNPAKDKLAITFRVEKEKDGILSIHDLSGQKLMEKSFRSSDSGYYKETLDVGAIKPGIYLVKLLANDLIWTGRLMISR